MIKTILLFILLSTSFVAATNLDIKVENNTLALSIEDYHWSFNTSENISTTVGFQVGELNCSFDKWMLEMENDVNYTFKKCNDIWKANTLLAVNLESCDSGKNPKCAEQKSIAQNKTSELTTCTNNLKTKTTEYDTKNNALTTCETEKKQMYPSWWTWVGGFGVLAGCWYFWRYNKTGNTTNSRGVEDGKQAPTGMPSQESLDKLWRD